MTQGTPWTGSNVDTRRARWWQKASAFAAGWKDKLGTDAPLGAVVLGLSVAQHETQCGDAWPGEHNWGACQKRTLTQGEKAVLHTAGIVPNVHQVDAARAALAAAVAAGTLPAPIDEALHVDSNPTPQGSVWYFVYFWAFPDDEQGAAFFVHVLAQQRASCRTILESPTGTEEQLAAAMYASHYYGGFHDPTTPEGRQANIDDYARALARLTPGIRAALASWTAGATPPPEPPPPDPGDPAGWDLATVQGQQLALNKLGASPPLEVDGIAGPKTKAAVEAFQAAHQLQADGIVGPKTTAALRAALGLPTPS